MNATIPLVDLKAQMGSLREEIRKAIDEVLDSTAFAGGPFVERFEADFAAYCQCRHAVGVATGTAALWLALRGLEIGPGHEVITVPNTFIATAEAISLTGARPVFVDVDPVTQTMDPQKIEPAVSRHTRAIVPVHLYGHPADMGPILQIAARHDLRVVEDASQAHGARYRGRLVGGLGDAGCFSFYPGKNLGACGEAGVVVTNDSALAEKVQALRDHGQLRKHDHAWLGWNARMDGIQGAVLATKLKHLDRWNQARREHARQYTRFLEGLTEVTLPSEADWATNVYHLYVIRTPQRDALEAALRNEGIQCGLHYPVPVHRQPAYQHLKLPAGSLPVAEASARQVLSLPMFPELTPSQRDRVVDRIRRYFQQRQRLAGPIQSWPVASGVSLARTAER